MAHDQVQAASPCDVFRWPDGTVCYRCEADHYAQLGYGYEVVPVGAPEYAALSASHPCTGACGRSPADMRHCAGCGQ